MARIPWPSCWRVNSMLENIARMMQYCKNIKESAVPSGAVYMQCSSESPNKWSESSKIGGIAAVVAYFSKFETLALLDAFFFSLYVRATVVTLLHLFSLHCCILYRQYCSHILTESTWVILRFQCLAWDESWMPQVHQVSFVLSSPLLLICSCLPFMRYKFKYHIVRIIEDNVVELITNRFNKFSHVAFIFQNFVQAACRFISCVRIYNSIRAYIVHLRHKRQ